MNNNNTAPFPPPTGLRDHTPFRLERLRAITAAAEVIIEQDRIHDALAWIAEGGEYFWQLVEALTEELSYTEENEGWARRHGVLEVRSLLLTCLKDGDSPGGLDL